MHTNTGTHIIIIIITNYINNSVAIVFMHVHVCGIKKANLVLELARFMSSLTLIHMTDGD